MSNNSNGPTSGSSPQVISLSGYRQKKSLEKKDTSEPSLVENPKAFAKWWLQEMHRLPDEIGGNVSNHLRSSLEELFRDVKRAQKTLPCRRVFEWLPDGVRAKFGPEIIGGSPIEAWLQYRQEWTNLDIRFSDHLLPFDAVLPLSWSTIDPDLNGAQVGSAKQFYQVVLRFLELEFGRLLQLPGAWPQAKLTNLCHTDAGRFVGSAVGVWDGHFKSLPGLIESISLQEGCDKFLLPIRPPKSAGPTDTVVEQKLLQELEFVGFDGLEPGDFRP